MAKFLTGITPHRVFTVAYNLISINKIFYRVKGAPQSRDGKKSPNFFLKHFCTVDSVAQCQMIHFVAIPPEDRKAEACGGTAVRGWLVILVIEISSYDIY